MYCLSNKIHSKIRVYILILACLASTLVSPASHSQNILFDHLDTESTLPHPFINAIVQDQQGFIWFGTQNGLSRFDGRKVSHYYSQPDDPFSLSNNWISSLFSDSEGRLWIGSANGAHLYTPETNSFINLEAKEIKGTSVNGIAEDQNGNIWFSTNYSGVIEYQVKSGKFTRYKGYGSEQEAIEINNVLVDQNNNVWLATAQQGILFKANNSQQFQQLPIELPSQNIKVLYLTKDNHILVGTENAGAFSIKEQTIDNNFSELATKCSASVNTILQDKSGEVWLGTDQGLCQITTMGQIIAHKQNKMNKAGLADNRVLSLTQDSGGVIWIGTASGVSKWNASLIYFDHLTEMNHKALASNSIMAFTAIADNLFVGSWGHGISRLQLPESKASLTLFDQRLMSLAQESVTSLFADSQRNLWVGTYRNGLYILPYASEEIVHIEQTNSAVELTSNSVSKFIELADGSILVSTYGGGLNNVRFTEQQLVNTTMHSNLTQLPAKYVLDVAANEQQQLWIASSDEGLVKYDLNTGDSFNLFRDSASFQEFNIEEVFNLVIDDNFIWAATGAGLLQVAKPINSDAEIAYKLINNQQGLASNFVYGVLKDQYGHIWLSHAKGVSRYTPETQKLQNFNTTHGLQGVDFNSSALYQTAKGRLLFGGSNGFNSFLPDQIPINTYQPRLRLTGFKQENTNVRLQSKLAADGFIELKHNETVIDFEFAALDFTRPENNKYRYKMLGMSQVWHDLGNNNLVSFSHLPPGSYELNVQGSNNDGVWSQSVRIPIRVLPPIWQTSYAYIIYLLACFGILFFTFKQQKQQSLKRKAHARHLHRLAYYDALTGLANRQNFYESLTNYLKLADQQKTGAWILLFNLDRFKRINDTLGHEFGDKVLVEVANRVVHWLSTHPLTSPLHVDNKFDSNFARLGGDEFTLLINKISHKTQITQVIEQLVELISKPIEIDKYQVTITPSIGVASYPNNGENVSDLLKNADIALHQAKAEGRRTHKFYSDVLDNKALERLQIEELMRDAINEEEFELYYQPQVNVKQNKVTKAEALIRWRSPVLGFVSPADFIPIAEESGLIIELGDWILTKACQQAKHWQDVGLKDCRVSVNVSSVQFKQSALLNKIAAALEESQLAPELLEIELTESAIMSDLEDNIARLNALKNMGVSIACDDFGTGYSSLSYLKQFPLDTLKIDRSFVNDIATDENDAAIVKAIMLLAETMQLNVVAEGVETLEQLQMLNRYNCELIQGFYFSKPLSHDDFIQFVQESFYQDKFMWELELIGK